MLADASSVTDWHEIILLSLALRLINVVSINYRKQYVYIV